MKWLFALSLLALMILGFYIMDRIDHFIASPYFFPDIEERGTNRNKSEKALIFGDHPVSADIVKLLELRNMPYKITTDLEETEYAESFEYLFAVDDSDFENLMICTVGERIMGISHRIAICNSFENRKIYMDKHIPYLNAEGISAEKLVNIILSSSRGNSNV